MSDLPSRADAKDWSDRYAEVVNDRSMVRIVAAYASSRLVDREASGLPIAWCYTHNAVRDHHVETERCDVPRSLLFNLDSAIGGTS